MRYSIKFNFQHQWCLLYWVALNYTFLFLLIDSLKFYLFLSLLHLHPLNLFIVSNFLQLNYEAGLERITGHMEGGAQEEASGFLSARSLTWRWLWLNAACLWAATPLDPRFCHSCSSEKPKTLWFSLLTGQALLSSQTWGAVSVCSCRCACVWTGVWWGHTRSREEESEAGKEVLLRAQYVQKWCSKTPG